jgi:hypothetical protein
MNESRTFATVDAAVAYAHENGADVYRRARRYVAVQDGTLSYLQGGDGERRWAVMGMLATPVPAT